MACSPARSSSVRDRSRRRSVSIGSVAVAWLQRPPQREVAIGRGAASHDDEAVAVVERPPARVARVHIQDVGVDTTADAPMELVEQRTTDAGAVGGRMGVDARQLRSARSLAEAQVANDLAVTLGDEEFGLGVLCGPGRPPGKRLGRVVRGKELVDEGAREDVAVRVPPAGFGDRGDARGIVRTGVADGDRGQPTVGLARIGHGESRRARNPSSSRTGTPSCSAFASLLPALSPATR